ncbi:MAG: glutamine--fructose-6-phosphate transaminase (isomerizing) [Candidatus Aenigmarchaeota archaeon]|nr:glutamine--fructose-6-phosphate transaminase (isomerizing) [Candidatus Aenigmarchaeota archaeon]
MCGIIGYIGEKQAAPIIFSGLKKLEYRGYDSAGIATLNNGIHIKKDVGKVKDIHSRINLTDLPGFIGIGHTRWATHGGVTKENAHPHTDCSGEIVIVHNGIIENFQELKRELKHHKLKSETDSEIIAHLIEEEMENKGFVEAAKTALKRVEGHFSLLILNKNDKRMIAARRGSPLVIGVGKGEYFPASDIPAFLDYTKDVIYLHDNDFVVLDKNGPKFFNLKNGENIERVVSTVDWDAEQAKKGEFEHFMLKEIIEQTETIQKAINQKMEIVEEVVGDIKNAQGIFFVGCGTAYHACLTGSYLFSKVAKKHVNVVSGSEFPHFEHFLTDKTLVIAVSQSGETADVLEAVKTARKRGSKVLSIVNVMGSSLTRNSDKVLLTHSGPEICVLSTKAYTAQLALMLLLAYATAGKIEDGRDQLKNLYNMVYNLTALSKRKKLKKLAEKLKDKEHIFTIGRGLMYPTALEAALKLKEVSYIHTEGFAGGDLKHGTIALIEKGTPCITFVSNGTEKEILSNAMEIKSRGGYIIGVGPKNNDIFDYFIKVPKSSVADPITHIIPMQILAYQLAVLRGCDPDKPRNLAKSVTVK